MKKVKIIKRTTIEGDLAKSIVEVLPTDTGNVIMIDKYVLTKNDPEVFFSLGFRYLRAFNGRRLFYQNFAVRQSTLMEIVEFVNEP